MNYEAIIHAFIDDIVENKDGIMIRELPNESENDVTILVAASNNDIARLIGHKGSVATALREVIAITGKLNNKKIHLKFESFEGESKGE
ncbi:MAG: KH domain-containing protein [Bacilli bacterium]